MHLFTQKPTLLLVVGLLLLVLGIPLAIYYSQRDVTGIGIGAILVVMLAAGLALAIDRAAVQFIAPRLLSIVELVVLVGAGVWISYASRTVTLDLTANQAPYIVLIWTKTPSQMTRLENRFPFNKETTLSVGNVVELDQALFPITTVKVPAHWKGQFSRGTSLTHPLFASAYFYGPEAYLKNSAEVDRLVQLAVVRQSAGRP